MNSYYAQILLAKADRHELSDLQRLNPDIQMRGARRFKWQALGCKDQRDYSLEELAELLVKTRASPTIYSARKSAPGLVGTRVPISPDRELVFQSLEVPTGDGLSVRNVKYRISVAETEVMRTY